MDARHSVSEILARLRGAEPDWDAYGEGSRRAGYGHLLGQQAAEGHESLAFMRCGCSFLVGTRPDLMELDTVCGNCQRNAENPSLDAPRSHPARSDNRALVAAGVLVLLVFAYFGWSVDRAPDRTPTTMEAS